MHGFTSVAEPEVQLTDGRCKAIIFWRCYYAFSRHLDMSSETIHTATQSRLKQVAAPQARVRSFNRDSSIRSGSVNHSAGMASAPV